MIYQMTSAKEVIARVDNKFDIDYADWLPRAPLWIANALDDMTLAAAYEQAPALTASVVDYICALPDDLPADLKHLDGVEYDGTLLRRLNIVNPQNQLATVFKYNTLETYSIINGYIQTSFETGDVTFHYKRVPIEFDTDHQCYFPKVPINSEIQEAIAWYIMYSILLRGHKHPTFSLDSNNPITNPYMMWERTRRKAKAAAGAMDIEERANMSRLIRTFIVDLSDNRIQNFEEDYS